MYEMTNKIKLFNNPNLGQVRTVEIEAKIYFVAADVVKALGYTNIKDAISRHCRCVVNHDIPHPQSKDKLMEVMVIPEGDVYRLIVKAADQSINQEIKEKAEQFEKWIFDEVIPQIRQTGSYVREDRSRDLMVINLIKFQQELEGMERELFEAEVNTAKARKVYRDWIEHTNKIKEKISLVKNIIRLTARAIPTKDIEQRIRQVLPK